MKQLSAIGIAAFIFLSAGIVSAETVDQKIKKGEANGTIKIRTLEQTRDACDRQNDITITSTTDGNVVLKPGETKYFKIKKDQDGYTRSGGWYWNCGDSHQKARIKGSTYIKAIRKDNGVTDWYWVEIEID